MTKWSRTAGAEAFLREFPDEPRNMYHKAPQILRQQMPQIADQVLALEPEHSNDFYLEATANDIVNALPDDLAIDADEIFVARTANFAANAEAFAPAQDARLAYVYQGLSTALLSYAYLMRRSYDFVATLDRSTIATAKDAIPAARSRFHELLSDPDIQLVLDRRQRWADDIDLDDELTAVLTGMTDRLSNGHLAINELHDRGEHFVVAHEMAHHLLGHTHHHSFEFRLHPAGVHLAELRSITGVYIDQDKWTEKQVQEFDADAFAFLVLAGEIWEHGSFDRAYWYGAIFAALLALPALEDLAVMSTSNSQDDEGALRRIIDETHPPLFSRIEQIVALVQAFPELPPAEEAAGHPVGLLIQVLIFRELLAASRSLR